MSEVFSHFADELGVTTMGVSEVVNRNRVSDRVMRFVASRIGKSHLEVFPEYDFSPKKRNTSKAVNG